MNRFTFVMTLLMSSFILANAAHTFDAHRLFQIQKNKVPLGSQRALVNYIAKDHEAASSLARSIVLIPLNEFSLELFDDLTTKKNLDSILVLLPNNTQDITQDTLSKWQKIEKDLLKRSVSIPFYFAFEDEKMQSLVQDLKTLNNDSDNYQFVTTTAEPAPIKEISVTNFQGWLAGESLDENNKIVPTIAIASYYDTFSIAPGAPGGLDSNGSGVVALLEIARLFSLLYSNRSTQGAYNLLFVLNGAGRANHAGTRHWISQLDNRILESIQFVLCLDSLLGVNDVQNNALYMHVSKLSKEEYAQNLYESFNVTAKELSIPFNFVQKKINISDDEHYWQHEAFSRKRILAATLSHLPSHPASNLEKSSIFDRRVDNATVELLTKKIKFIAESVARFVYLKGGNDNSLTGVKEANVFSGQYAVDTEFVASWLHNLTFVSMFQPLLDKKSVILQSIEKGLSLYSTVATQVFKLDSDIVYYDASTVSMSAYKVKHFTFDFMLSAVIVLYLVFLYAALKGPSAFIAEVQSALNPKSTKKTVTQKKKKST